MTHQRYRIPLVAGFRFIHEPFLEASQPAAAYFVGRENDLDDLCTRLLFSEGGAFLVTGYRGVGKTSFVNQVVSRLRLSLAGLRGDGTELVDVQLNLARAISPVELMHYMVRALRERLIETGIFARLPPSLAADVELAFLRTSFSVAYKQSASSERSMSTNFKLQMPGFSLGPSLGLTAKRSDELARDLSCLAYDEKTAEYDLIRLSRRLRVGYVRRSLWTWVRPRAQRVGLKLLFVFDELDKLEASPPPSDQAPSLDTIFSTLKNLFTASGISFVFIAGKDLQERWLEDVGRGDSIYESIFTYVKYLPTLDCGDRICDAFLAGEQDGAPSDIETCRLFKKYLVFKGRGIPRRILRSFNEYVTWDGDNAGLDFSKEDLRQFRFYSGLLDHLQANEDELVEPTAEESGFADQRRLGLYYLCDWILRRGTSEFALEDAILASRQLSRLIAPGESVAPGLVTRLLSVMATGEYIEEVNRPLAQLEAGVASYQTVKRYRLASRRLAEMGQQSKRFEQEADAVLAQLELRPQVAERYQIGKEVGRGAMSIVYEGTDTKTGRRVAVKMLDRTLMADPELVQRFRREAEIHSRLQHPNVVRIFDHAVSEAGAFIVMEFLDGVLLQELVAQGVTTNLDVSLAIAREVLLAMDHLHEQKILWRDAKPSNVMITPEGRIVILDFGISLLIQDTTTEITLIGHVVGTPDYMSPEQVTGGPIDARSDLFGFGAVLYEMISGEQPFHGQGLRETLGRIISVAPVPLPAASPEIEVILMRCLAKAPEARFQSARELLEALPLPRGVVDLGAVVRAASERAVQWAREHNQGTVAGTGVLEAAAPHRAVEPPEPDAPQRDSAAPVLLVMRPREERWLLTGERYRIGRDPECEIVVVDAMVSRVHAKLVRSEGDYYVQDLNTANGLLVDGVRVSRADLRDGAVITIGLNCEMRYLRPLHSASDTAPRLEVAESIMEL